MYSECATMCSSASGNSASPHCITMKPICATVDQASEVFTADWVSITSPPNSAVNRHPAVWEPGGTFARAAVAPARRVVLTNQALASDALTPLIVHEISR